MHGRPSKDLKQVGEKVEANDGDTPMNKDHDEEDLGMQEEEITSLATQRPKRKSGWEG